MIDEQALRALVRDAIARHGRRGPSEPAARGLPPPACLQISAHASHVRLPLGRGEDGDGACLIEPVAGCSHCGYCQSYGH